MRSRHRKLSDEEVDAIVLIAAEFIYSIYGKGRLYEYNCPAGSARSAFLNLVIESVEFGYIRRQLSDEQIDFIDSPGRGRYFVLGKSIDRLKRETKIISYPAMVKASVGRRTIEKDDEFYRPASVLEQIALQAD